MKVLIVSGGTPPSEELFKEEVEKCDILIGADKGCEIYFKYNVVPQYAIGDFDSISDKTREKLVNTKVIKYNPLKDNTDSEIALLKAIDMGAKDIILLGFTGSRLDHTLSNLGLLDICLEKKIEAYIRDDNNLIYLTDKPIVLEKSWGNYISFQAFRDKVENFSISGAKYELEGYTLNFGDGRCVSNEFLENHITIDFNSGKVLIIYSKD